MQEQGTETNREYPQDVRKGEKTIVSFKVWDREEEQTELYALKRFVVRGERNGPHVVINAGSHGDEFLAIDTAKKVYEELDPEDVNGTISIVPEANLFAALRNKRETPEPEFELYESEERNLNRCFNSVDLEAGPEGNITERLAYHLLKLVAGADYCLDLHTGTAPGHKIDHIRGKTNPAFDTDVMRAQERLIRSSGMQYVIKTPTDRMGDGMLASVAPQHGVPTVTLEVGGGAYAEEELEWFTEVVMNLLKEAGSLYGEPPSVKQQIYRDLMDVSSPTAGAYTALKEPGEDIKRGEVLGEIVNDQGTHEVVCPYDGLVESAHREDWVNEGSRIAFIAIRQERGIRATISEALRQLVDAYLEWAPHTKVREGLSRWA